MQHRRYGWIVVAGLAALVAWWVLRGTDESMGPAAAEDAETAGGPQSVADAAAVKTHPRAKAANAAAEGVAADGDMTPGKALSGNAWSDDEQERPLPGVLVRAFPGDVHRQADAELDPLLSDPPTQGDVARTTTGAGGAFRLDVGSAGVWRIVATCDGHATVAATSRAGESHISLVMPPLVPCSVRVTDEMDAPIPGAELRVGWNESPAPPHAVVVTGEDGRAVVPAHVGGAMIVRATGFALTRIEWDERPPATIVLRRGLPCGGVVADSAGAPIADAVVTLHGDGVVPRTVRTPADGSFRFDAVCAGILRLQAEGFIQRDLDVVPGDSAMRVVLDRGEVVAGVVVDPAGSPQAGADVSGGAAKTRTDAQGRYRLLVPVGTTTLYARLDDKRSLGAAFVGSAEIPEAAAGAPGRTAAHAAEDVRIVLAAPPDLSFVTVEVPEAAGPPERRVHLYAMEAGSYLGALELIGPHPADFAVRIAPGTDIEVRGYLDDGSAAFPTLVVPSVRTARVPPYPRVVLRTVTGPGLTVRVVGDGRERADLLEHVSVSARPAGSGRWTLPPFAPVARVAFVAPGWASYGGNFVAPDRQRWREWLARGEFPEFDLEVPLRRPATVRARAVDPGAGPGDSEPSWNLEVRTEGPIGHAASGSAARDGTIVVLAVPPGRATLFVHPSSAQPIRREFDVEEGATIDLGDLSPERPVPRWYEGVAQDETGRALGGVRIAPELAQGGWADEPGWSAPDGTWRIRAPDVPGLRLVCRRAGRARTVVVPAPGTEKTVVTLLPGGSVHVRIPKRPPGGLITWFLRLPGDPFHFDTPTSPGPAGRGDWQSWTVSDVPPGPVEVVIKLRTDEQVRRVVVVPGGTVEAVFGDE